MKKRLVTVICAAAVLAMTGCASSSSTATTETAEAATEVATEAAEVATEAATEEAAEVATEAAEETGEKSEGVMTYEEYVAADVDTEVTVETYVQDKQGWWEDNGVGQATIYTQDQEGGYFLYNMPMSEDEYNALTEGTKIKVTGYKSEWSGEVEIIDATFEVEDGSYVAEPVDVTDLLANEEELILHQNQKVAFTGLTVEPASEDSDAAFLYNWDGSGSEGDDLYFNVSLDGQTYSFVVESYLRGADTDVYKAVQALQVGDAIDCEGFLYWYEGANPHITTVTVQ